MRHRLFSFIFALVASITFASAAVYNGNCGANGSNVTWNLDTSVGTLTISGTGAMKDYSTTSSATRPGWYNYTYNVKKIVISEGVTYIGNRAFEGCWATDVIIPNSITSIGSCAFINCSHFEKVTISDLSVWCNIAMTDFASTPLGRATHLFIGDTEITDIVIPDEITSIGAYTFYGFKEMTSVTIHDNVNSIGASAFYNCTNLTSISIPNNVTEIAKQTFYNCQNLTSVSLGNNVSSIGDGAFQQCAKIDTFVCNTVTPPAVGTNVFIGIIAPIHVIVPEGSEAAYKEADGWKFLYRGPIVTYKDWDGTILKQDTTELNGASTPPANPRREGYTFCGWDKSFSKVTDDLVVTALYLQKPPTDMPASEVGAINGVFSVAEGRQVVFSKGNLQYNAAQGTHACADGTTQQGTWRFAENQLEIRAYENSNRNETYNGWIDLFHYGASGYNGMIPYRNTPADAAMYQQVGVLQGSYYDFGLYNAISNGGNQPGIWRLFTQNEWHYIVRDRANALRLRAHATINGVEGLIILPDNCDTTALRNIASYNPSDYVMNNYSLTAWKSIEALGVVFLPVSGAMDYRFSYLVWDGNSTHYMCAYSSQLSSISCASFSTNYIGSSTSSATAISVRLVQDVDVFHLNAVSNNTAWGTVSGDSLYWNEAISMTATPNEGYHFVQWSDGVTDNPRAFTLTADSTITAEFAPNTFTLNVTCDAEQGLITGESGAFDYLSEHTFEAVANPGHTFLAWSDGVKENPRTIVLTHDSTIYALFELGEYTDFIININTKDGELILSNNVVLKMPVAPQIEGFTFVGWRPVATIIEDNTIDIEAVYTADVPSSAPEVVTNPADSTQKLIREGNVYILKGNKTYTITGQAVK